MRIVIHPLRDAAHPIDVTDAVVEAVARELGRRCGGNAVLNRLEAAAQLEQALGAHDAHRRAADGLDVIEGTARELEAEEASHDLDWNDRDPRRITSRPDRRVRQPQGLALQGPSRVAGADAAR